MELKMCTKCKEKKDINEFNKGQYTCKECQKKYYQENKVRYKEKNKNLRKNNKDKNSKYIKELITINKNRFSKIKKIYKQGYSTNVILLERIPYDDEPLLIDGYITVLCKYCHKRFKPTNSQLEHRYARFEGKCTGDSNFYCQDECKQLCPIFRKQKYQEDHPNKHNTYRNEQPALRELCFERDNYTCQKCGSIEDLHCHHFEGVELNPIESCDLDNVITLCENCHEDAHNEMGCRYTDLRRQKCEV